MKFFIPLYVTTLLPSVYAQVVLRITSLPSNTPNDATIYFAGSINNWAPGNSSYTLTEDGFGAKVITIPEGTGTVEYKFTRDGWPSVEGDANGFEIGNRNFTFTGQPQTLNLVVQSWKDLGGTANSTGASNVQILSTNFFMPQLNRNRKIWLYLPPDYHTSTKNYPVIYMHDGQNLFDNATSFSGEWQVDETLNNLHQNGDYGAIVVGIDNGGAERINEYGPWVNTQYNAGGQGAQYMDFIVETLKPYIDANFRTFPQAPYTVMIGSSLGALIATYGHVRSASIFGKIGSFSPAYWFNLTELNNYIQSANVNLANARYYFVAGQNESSTMVGNITTIRSALQSKGLTSNNTFTKIDSYGTHTEGYWRGEFAAAYQWLFATTSLSTAEHPSEQMQLFQMGSHQIFASGIDTSKSFQIIDLSGKIVQSIKLNEGINDLPNNLPAGIYFLRNEDVKLKVYCLGW